MSGGSTFRVGLIQMRSGRAPAANMEAAAKLRTTRGTASRARRDSTGRLDPQPDTAGRGRWAHGERALRSDAGIRRPLPDCTGTGDGGSSRGDFHEAMNFAAVRQLPVVFFCNNNQYAYSTPQRLQMAIHDVADRAKAYGMPGEIVDGNDVAVATLNFPEVVLFHRTGFRDPALHAALYAER